MPAGARATHPVPRTHQGRRPRTGWPHQRSQLVRQPDHGPAVKARRLAMTRLNVNEARCEALFVSGLQASDAPTADVLTEVISRGDQPHRAAVRRPWLRLPDGTGVRRPSRGGHRTHAVGPAVAGRGACLAGPAGRRPRPERRMTPGSRRALEQGRQGWWPRCRTALSPPAVRGSARSVARRCCWPSSPSSRSARRPRW